MEQSRSTEEIMGGGVTHHLWSILGVQRWERGAKEIWGRQVHSLWWGGGFSWSCRRPSNSPGSYFWPSLPVPRGSTGNTRALSAAASREALGQRGGWGGSGGLGRIWGGWGGSGGGVRLQQRCPVAAERAAGSPMAVC